jgi:hypothetical protein
MLLLFLAFLISFECCKADVVTIRNDVPRYDTDGNIVSAGDGCLSYHPDEQRYYLFGAHYQPCSEPNNDCYAGSGGFDQCKQHKKFDSAHCCGWRNATIAAWSSSDLVTWELEGLNILPVLTSNLSTYSSEYMAVFEPCGVYNRKTGFWNLFFLRDGYHLARAVARTAAGPFDVLQWTVPVPGMSEIVDFYFWQNASTGDLIMKHNSEVGGEFAVTFSDDYLSITGTSAVMGHEQGYTEGGGIFQYNGDTFVMAGYGCCFCTRGSNGFLWRSDSVLGNYTLLGDKIPRYANQTAVTHAQMFSVAPIYTRAGVTPMFVGIRFGSAPDFVKDHDFQYWYPLSFDDSNDMHNVTWVDSFSLDLFPPPPPPPVTPAAPWYSCSLMTLGACVEVPAGAPGAVASLGECETQCVPQYACSQDAIGMCEIVPAGTPGANATLAACEEQCAPVFVCSGAGGCTEEPAGTPGGVATLAECAALCVQCNLSGTWVGSARGVKIFLAQTAINASAATAVVWTEPAVWPSNATGVVTPGFLTVTGGWCGGAPCVGPVSPLEAGGVNCAKITWGGADGSWCNPDLEPTRCSNSS